MLAIRFNRVGKRNKVQFRIVVQEHTVAPGGRHVEIVGNYDPHQKKGVFKDERIKYWMEKGAKLSDSVHNLLVAQGIISDKKRAIKIKAKKSKETEETKEKGEKKNEVKESKVENEKEGQDKAEKKPVDDESEKTADTVAKADKEEKKEEKAEKKDK